jgi:HEAT repeat protein
MLWICPKSFEYIPHREAAATALGEIGDPRAVNPLIAVLKNGNPDLKIEASRALGKIGDVSGVKPLLAALNDESGGVRTEAVQALVKIGGDAAVNGLIKALTDPAVRFAAAEALVMLGDERAIRPLIAVFIKDAPFSSILTTALAKFGPAAHEPLLNAFLEDDILVKYHVARALELSGWKPGKDEKSAAILVYAGKMDKCVSIGAPAVKPLIGALDHGDKKTRLAAARALVRLYQSKSLSVEDRAQILAQKSTITSHDDYQRNTGIISSDCHYEYAHVDDGIGIAFPD